jgi:putative FmdB family regulatory protein
MPTYQYQCKKCGFELEELQSMKEPPLVHCPRCKTDNLARIMSSGSGLIFKGSGFYLTDYRKSAKDTQKTVKKGDTKSASSDSSPAPENKSSESKPSGDSTPPPAKKE